MNAKQDCVTRSLVMMEKFYIILQVDLVLGPARNSEILVIVI